MLEFISIYVNSQYYRLTFSSSVRCIFDNDQSSNKVLFIDLVDSSLLHITSVIAELTETLNVFHCDPNFKRRFVLQKDYIEYYNALVDAYTVSQSSESGLVNRLRALLLLMQNNIFYNIVKITKLIKFYKLNWKDDVRLLANANAFKNYLLRIYIGNSEKKGDDGNKLEEREDKFLAAMRTVKYKKGN